MEGGQRRIQELSIGGFQNAICTKAESKEILLIILRCLKVSRFHEIIKDPGQSFEILPKFRQFLATHLIIKANPESALQSSSLFGL